MDYAYDVTTHGRAVMAACLALERPLHITRVAFGSGLVDESTDLTGVHELVEYVAEGAVADRQHRDDRLTITIQYANREHPGVPTFLLSEFMVFVEDPETGGETDIFYGTLGDYRQPVPAYNAMYPPSVFNFPLELILSSELNVCISAPAGLVTWEDMECLMFGTSATVAVDLTIPVTGWEADEDTRGTYPLHTDIARDEITEDMVPVVTIPPEHLTAAGLCGLCPTARTIPGALRLYAKQAPKAPIAASLALILSGSRIMPSGAIAGGGALSPATRNSLGLVKVGDGLKIMPDGKLSVDVATPEELAEIFAQEPQDQDSSDG